MGTIAAVTAFAVLAGTAALGATGGQSTPQPSCGVKTDKSNYGLGEPVTISFVVENRTKEEITLRFPSSQRYDVWVVKDGTEVWRWSRGRVFAQAITSLVLRPGDKKVFEETWKQISDDRKEAAPGAYDVFAQLTTFPPRPSPVKAHITLGKAEPVVTPTTIGAIVDNVDAALGQVVSITGVYRGWRPDANSPACRPGPPVTKSDWAVSDQTGCIFVTGPSGPDATNDYGKQITVVGTVCKTDKGQPYIEAKNVTATER